jgi:hypothetical protein
MHLAGASTVVVPVWSGATNGMHGTLAHTLILIYFYAQLALDSKEAFPVTSAMRKAQLWLRDSRWDDLATWVRKCHIPETQRLSICADLERVYKTLQRERGEFSKVDKKIFSHFIYWGSYQVCGYARSIFPVELAIENEDDKARRALAYLAKTEAKKIRHRQNKMDPNDPFDAKLAMGKESEPTGLKAWFSKTGLSEAKKFKLRQQEMGLEADVLVYEGKVREAKILRALMKKEKMERNAKKWKDAYSFGKRIYDNFASGIDAMLDSDSDDSEHQRKKEAEKEAGKKVDILKEGKASMSTLANGAVMSGHKGGGATAGHSLMSSPNIQMRSSAKSASPGARAPARRYAAAKRENSDSETNSDSDQSGASSASDLTRNDGDPSSDDEHPQRRPKGMSEEEYIASFKYYDKKDSIYDKQKASEVCAIM